MFLRLEQIKGCGIFDDFRWDEAVPELVKINVIYGRNGAGKTSLAGALDGLRHPAAGSGWARVSALWADDAGTRSTGCKDDSAFDRIHVFSEHYVARSHRFTPADADMAAVLTIGERPVDAEQRLEALRVTIESKTALRDQASKDEVAARRVIDSAYGRVSQQVVDAAGKAGGRWHSRSNFSAATVRKAYGLPRSSWVELSESDLQDKIGLINSDKAEALGDSQLAVSVPPDLVDRLRVALGATPATVMLDTLAAHPGATSWVDAGRQLHVDASTCIYCASELTGERKSQIDRHFSDQVERLQIELRDVADKLQRIENAIDVALQSVPSKGLFFEDLRPRYDQAAETIRTELGVLKEWVSQQKTRASDKAENVLGVVDAVVGAAPMVQGSELMALRKAHNDRVKDHDSLVGAAAQAIELHYLKLAESAVDESSAVMSRNHEVVERLDRELRECRDEVASLEQVDGDPTPTAKVLTEEVARLLGRSELTFESVDGRYRVLRLGQPAIGLSVGERTAITLVHFLECVARCDVSNGRPIVIIDDPVSSLDSDVFMGVSTYIWNEAVVKDHIEQLILLTHNFELFRQWDIQLESLHKGGRDKKSGKKLVELYPARLYEMRSRHVTVAGQTRRRPALVQWPPSEQVRKKVRSSYHHAFISVSEVLKSLAEEDSLENRLDAQLLFPNVVRRMLETFIAFKRPDWAGDLNTAMRNSAELLAEGGYVGDPDALRLRLTRYVHAHSHADDPSTNHLLAPDEVETALRSVFEFMNHVDSGHFQGLCSAIEVDPADLLPAPPPAVEDASVAVADAEALRAV